MPTSLDVAMLHAQPRPYPHRANQRSVALAVSRAFVVAVAIVGVTAAQADGLKISPQQAWPTWQARLGVLAPASGVGLEARPASGTKASVLGDYYFTGSGFDPNRIGGGLRATSGWLLGGLNALQAVAPITSTPLSASLQRGPSVDDRSHGSAAYLGIGYTGLHRSGLGFAADFGLVGTRQQGPRLDTDYVLRDTIRLTPTVRLGMSYSF